MIICGGDSHIEVPIWIAKALSEHRRDTISIVSFVLDVSCRLSLRAVRLPRELAISPDKLDLAWEKEHVFDLPLCRSSPLPRARCPFGVWLGQLAASSIKHLRTTHRALGRIMLCLAGFFDRSMEDTCGLDLENLLLNCVYVDFLSPAVLTVSMMGLSGARLGRDCITASTGDFSGVRLTKLPPSEVPMSSFVLQMGFHTHPH